MADTYDEPVSLDAVRMVAGLAIQAGVQLSFDGDTAHLPARGWMPPPATGSPEVEYGAAMAVNAICVAFDLDLEQVAFVGAQLIP